MEKGYPMIKLDGLQYDLEDAINALSAVIMAVEDGSAATESFTGAYRAVHAHLYHLNSQMRNYVDALFEEARAAKIEGQNGKMSS